MFKPRNNKKRRKPVQIRTAGDSSSDENGSTVVKRRGRDEDGDDTAASDKGPSSLKGKLDKKAVKKSKKKRKEKAKQSVSSLSFNDNVDMDEEGFDGEVSRWSGGKKSKKRKGLGFGGGPMIPDEEIRNGTDTGGPVGGEVTDEDETPRYGAESLEALKAAQKYTMPAPSSIKEKNVTGDENGGEFISQSAPTSIEDLEQQMSSKRKSDNTKSDMNEDFIPLSGAKRDIKVASVVLNGDDASLLASKRAEGAIALNKFIDTMEEDDAADEWENELARRGTRTSAPRVDLKKGGLPPQVSNMEKEESNGSDYINENKDDEKLKKLKTAMNDILLRIEETRSELKSTLDRRKIELDHVKEDHKKYFKEASQAESVSAGSQSLRKNLANWIGALRDLNPKLEELETALDSIVEEKHSLREKRQHDFEDDLLEMLETHDLLRSNGGRKTNVQRIMMKTNDSVDEFGRRVVNQELLKRDQRTSRRWQIALRKLSTAPSDQKSNTEFIHSCKDMAEEYGSLTDIETSDSEEENFLVREESVYAALEVAVSETSEEYLTIDGILKLQSQWKNTFPDEGTQHNSLSDFNELIAVLVRYQLVKIKYIDKTPEALSFMDDLDQNMVGRILFERLVFYIEKGYDLHSTSETVYISQGFEYLKKIILSKELSKSLNEVVIKKFRMVLENMSVPSLNIDEESIKKFDVQSDEISRLHFFASSQVYRLVKIVRNICEYWVPCFRRESTISTEVLLEIGKIVLNEAWRRRLSEYLLHLQSIEVFRSVGKLIFDAFCVQINLTDWLSLNEFQWAKASMMASGMML